MLVTASNCAAEVFMGCQVLHYQAGTQIQSQNLHITLL